MARRPRFTVQVDGLDKLKAQLDKLPAAVIAGAQRATHDEVEETADDMRRNAPVRTGELRDGIQAEHDEDGLGGNAVSTARHSTFVEHGTSSTPEQPFVLPAAEASRQRYPDRMRREVGSSIQEAIK